eukprot:396343-Pelagomonas_calceolata.AAC.1
MNYFQGDELVVPSVHAAHKIQAGVALVDELHAAPVQEIAQAQGAGQHQAGGLLDGFGPLFLRVGGVPLGKAYLALPAHEDKEVDLQGEQCTHREC